jgi:selenoprotein W-related protein
MTSVTIEFCVPCGFIDRAVDLQRDILGVYGEQLDGVELVPGDGGVFVVAAGDEVVFDKATDEFDPDAIVDAVGEHVRATA